MAICKSTGFKICTDDNKARKCSGKELGSNQVVGSLYLLKQSVAGNTLSCVEALSVYALMIAKGAFLPSGLDKKYFCQ